MCRGEDYYDHPPWGSGAVHCGDREVRPRCRHDRSSCNQERQDRSWGEALPNLFRSRSCLLQSVPKLRFAGHTTLQSSFAHSFSLVVPILLPFTGTRWKRQYLDTLSFGAHQQNKILLPFFCMRRTQGSHNPSANSLFSWSKAPSSCPGVSLDQSHDHSHALDDDLIFCQQQTATASTSAIKRQNFVHVRLQK